MNWRPISEFPELEADGFSKPVLLFMEDYISVGFWTQRGRWMVRGMKIVEPTHWCEITPPSETGSDLAALRIDGERWRMRAIALVDVLRGVLDRCRHSGGYIGQDGQYQKVILAAIDEVQEFTAAVDALPPLDAMSAGGE